MMSITRCNILTLADQIRTARNPHAELVKVRKEEGVDVATAVSKLLTVWGVQVDPRT